MSSKNPCAKTMTPETAYEVWQSYDGTWTYFVLKKYQSSEKEAQNSYARWYCLVKTPITPNGEYGDVYVSTVKRGTHQVDNPLHRTICVKGTSITTLDAIGLSTYPLNELVLRDERLWQYLKLSLPPKDFAKVRYTAIFPADHFCSFVALVLLFAYTHSWIPRFLHISSFFCQLLLSLSISYTRPSEQGTNT